MRRNVLRDRSSMKTRIKRHEIENFSQPRIRKLLFVRSLHCSLRERRTCAKKAVTDAAGLWSSTRMGLVGSRGPDSGGGRLIEGEGAVSGFVR